MPDREHGRSPPSCLIMLPVYNVGGTIEETLTSLLRQTYKNYTIIISDNYSTDDSVEKIIKIDSGLKIIKPSKHLSGESHYNFCLDYAANLTFHKYLAIYHGDDIYSSDILSLQVRYMESYEHVPAVFTDAIIINGAGGRIGFIGSKPKSRLFSLYSFNELLYGMLSSTVCCLTPTIMLRSSVIKDSKLRFDTERYGRAADYGLWLTLAERFGSLGIVHQSCIQYRRQGNNASSQIAASSSESDGFRVIRELIGGEEKIKKHGWLWITHFHRLRAQDYVRRLRILLITNNCNCISAQLNIPKINILLVLVVSGKPFALLDLIAIMIIRLYRLGVLPTGVASTIFMTLTSEKLRNRIRSFRTNLHIRLSSTSRAGC